MCPIAEHRSLDPLLPGVARTVPAAPVFPAPTFAPPCRHRARIDGEIMIAAPAGQVFDLAADDRSELQYNPRILRAKQITDLHLVTVAS
jgi:hypothetical protein